jgi:2-dehydro-3-deoxygluconokinase
MLTFLTWPVSNQNILRRDNATVGLYLIELAEGERSHVRPAPRAPPQFAMRPLWSKRWEGASVAHLSGITCYPASADCARLFDVLQRFRDAVARRLTPNLRPKL